MTFIEIPEKAERILETLQGAGYEAYVVGGCVRDSILGRTPGDWDITTSASPQQVKALFPRTIDTGIEHGTVTVMDGGLPSSEERDIYVESDGGSEAQGFYDQCDGVCAEDRARG